MKYDPYKPVHFAVMILVSQAIVAALFWLILFHTEFGKDLSKSMPHVVKVALLVMTYVITCWFAITHRPRR